ncbi:hypothetical protein ACLUWA_03730 [Bifidobacterium thermophilum]|uniref:hypothetical protein n=1 Tax=Bifidobacterium thermophilum TaxID=33905 RepID=UPI00399532EB
MKDLRYESASLRSVGGSIIGVSQALTMTVQHREVHNMDAMVAENGQGKHDSVRIHSQTG